MMDEWLKEVFRKDDEFNAEMQRREYAFERQHGRPLRTSPRVKEEQQQSEERNEITALKKRVADLELSLAKDRQSLLMTIKAIGKFDAVHRREIKRLQDERTSIAAAMKYLTEHEFVPADRAHELVDRVQRLEKALVDMELVQDIRTAELRGNVVDLPSFPLRVRDAS
jgi:hypothetical protein